MSHIWHPRGIWEHVFTCGSTHVKCVPMTLKHVPLGDNTFPCWGTLYSHMGTCISKSLGNPCSILHPHLSTFCPHIRMPHSHACEQISATENSNNFQKTKFWKEKSVENGFTLGPTAQPTQVYLWRKVVGFVLFCGYAIHLTKMLQIMFLVYSQSSNEEGCMGLVPWRLDFRCKCSWILNDLFTKN